MKTIITGGLLVNEGRRQPGSIVVDNDRIADIITGNVTPRGHFDRTVDATGCVVMPGVIDDHVHFRQPGLTRKATIESESRAAAFGGVTSYLEMPNTVPQTTTVEALEEKLSIARKDSHVNYGFFFGATKDNSHLFGQIDRKAIPGIKLFMGSSTGNMLVDDGDALATIFRRAAELDLPLMTHCEDTAIINRNMKAMKQLHGDDPAVALHPQIRSTEACLKSSLTAMQMASRYSTRLHIAHITTRKEIELYEQHYQGSSISLEVCVPHLLFSDADYAAKGALIKCNPAVKSDDDRQALRRFIATTQQLATVGTDHAPHELHEKQGGAAKAMSGMPMVQFSLVAMLGLADDPSTGLTVERVVQLMCHNPATLFRIADRGYLRKGYKADIAIVRPASPWTIDSQAIQSKCGWSPLAGTTMQWRVEQTICNGQLVYDRGTINESIRGQQLSFDR
ncbi:MAG: dihydroorotase [Prevotella sp.]|nr:dihydroorotase [Prevotella sp.]